MENLAKSMLSTHDHHDSNFQINDFTLTTQFEILVNQLEKIFE